MKLNIYIFFFLLFASIASFGQNDSIVVKETFGGFNYFYQGSKIKNDQVLNILEQNTEAYDKFKSGSEAYVFANIFGIAGIILVAAPVGMRIFGEESNWTMAWAGASLIVVSIPLFHVYNKNTSKGLELYHNGLPYNNIDSPKAHLNIGATQNGIGLSLTF